MKKLTVTSSIIFQFIIAGVTVAAVLSVGNNAFETTRKSVSQPIPFANENGRGKNTALTERIGGRSLAAINPDLPFSDINILVVSDVHSHVAGHPHEPDRNADFGDLFSFHERLVAHSEEKGMGDVWLFDNGDILHGTGLAMDGNATNLLPILNSMPWDSMTMGRQEATYSDVLRDMNQTILPKFPGKYITSNVVWADTKEPYGKRYQFLRGRSSTILVLGFLYDTTSSSDTIEVASIEETLQQDWLLKILRQEHNILDDERYDAIVVMAHMDHYSPLIDKIYEVIRSNVDPQMPIQFIAGHSHKRERSDHLNEGKRRDNYVHRMEPGGLFDTIGWVTIPKFSTAKTFKARGIDDGLSKVFRQEFLNTSKTVLHSRLGLPEDEELRTEGGNAVSQLIDETRERLGLNQVVACPGHDYFRNISIHAHNSLWRLWRDHVVRGQIFKPGEDRVMLVSKGTMRYDLRGSGKHDAMTLDDIVAIAPYMEKVVYVGDVPDWMVRRMNSSLNTLSAHNIIPDYVMAGDLDEIKTAEKYQLYTHQVDVPRIKAKLEKFSFSDFKLTTTGQRDTLYWLDYVKSAFPCEGKKKKLKNETLEIQPYFYDPNELEEETTDGTFTLDDIEGDSNSGEQDSEEKTTSEDQIWTIPPNSNYQGYVPGKGESHEVTSSVYENYKSKAEIEEEANKKNREKAKALAGQKSYKKQHEDHKKTRKKMIKGFVILLAGLLLMVPVVCLVMQLTGKNDYYDNYNDDIVGGAAMYDVEEMRMLRRRRQRGTQPTQLEEQLESAPFREIEIM